MAWSRDQEIALKRVNDWYKNSDQQVCRVFGYAGTGKSTLALHFAEGVSNVVYGAFTGKAAHVMQQKGCKGASTIHSLIYRSRDKSKKHLKELEIMLGEMIHELRAEATLEEPIMQDPAIKEIQRKIEEERQNISRPFFELNFDSEIKYADLIIIDECSMVDGQLGEDLLSFGVKVLVLGDPAQLPPIYGSGFFTEGHKPDCMLEEIHRQARGNPIIDLATRARNKEVIPLGQYGDSQIIMHSRVTPEMVMETDQILVGRNATRFSSNKRARELLCHNSVLPVSGDKVVCLRNNHEIGLLNGAIWTVDHGGEVGTNLLHLNIIPENGGNPLDVMAHTHYFEGCGSDLNWWERKEAEEFDYGYALTAHKAQGSQWDDVVVFDESYCFRQDKWRWLYTAITRAAESLTLVRM